MAEKGGDSIVIQRREELNRQLARAEAERVAAEAGYRSVREADPSSLPEVRTSGLVQSLMTKYSTLREQHAELSSKFKQDWPEMQRLSSKMEEVRGNLDETVKEEGEKVVAAHRLAYQTALVRERLLRRSMDGQKKEIQELSRATADYDQIKMELDNQRQMLQSLVRRRSETDLSADLKEQQPVKVRVVQEADVPEYLFSPNHSVHLMFGGIMGVVLGIGLAVFLDLLDNTICTIEDLRQHVPLPFLGLIPRFNGGPSVSQGKTQALLKGRVGRLPARTSSQSLAIRKSSYLPLLYDQSQAHEESRSILSERFKFLRGSLLFSTPGTAPKVVLITSPEKNSGKTFVSCNLSAALVQLNKRVLLVDSDLRNPTLHRVFRYANRTGLTNVLTGQKSLHDGCIMRTDVPNLFLLMAGPKSPTPGELLASPAMEETIRNCSEHFDFIVLDSAPLLPVFDSHLLSAQCDAVLLVARCGLTSRNSIRTSIEQTERVNGKITGVVLNDVDINDMAQRYYHGHYGYGYESYPAAP